ncbi:MAG: M23 family metallopeptidase [Minisyncoccota bacterium]
MKAKNIRPRAYSGYLVAALLLASSLSVIVVSPARANAAVKYRWPLGSQTTIQNWVDHNPNVGSYYRYDCTSTGGYDGHQGTDTGASYGTAIYAGAQGGLYYRIDGCADTPNSSPDCAYGLGNHVRIQDADGHVAVYAHMKNGSPAYYATWLCGGKIGEVGASGLANYYHLHFEMWSDQYKSSIIDPFAGNCSQATSYWVNQNGGLPTTQCQ